MNVLTITPYFPSKNFNHAGGKTFNYYINKVYSKVATNHIVISNDTLSPSILNSDTSNLTFIHLHNSLNFSFFHKIIFFVLNLYFLINPFNKYLNLVSNTYIYSLKSQLKKLKISNFYPDIINFEWTQNVLLASEVKKLFPKSKFVANEYDVTFQSFQRKYIFEKNLVLKLIKYIRYFLLKNIELKSLKNFHLVIVQNFKDKLLLKKNGIKVDKLFQISPYFDKFNCKKTSNRKSTLIFYGAMNRKENYLSALWFYKNVFVHLPKDQYNFLIIGSNPHKSLNSIVNSSVHVTGYVEDICKYTQNALCLVAPLLLGAGIKVKILEAMAIGLPVLTNQIGIEGITDKKDNNFIFCETPEDYINSIICLFNDKNLYDTLIYNGKKLIEEKFNFEESASQLTNRLLKIANVNTIND